ncbi:Acetylcholine receptor subunit alpha-type des-2 [Dirofilaria immitis]|nr:Acetylcholine receptor subunit alpha-type des-2 [Dirofilaria immitis]
MMFVLIIPEMFDIICLIQPNHYANWIQQCTLLFGSWAHSNDSIKYALYSNDLSLIDFYDNQEWQLDSTHSHIISDSFLYDYLDPPLFWEMIIMDLVLIRQSFYYVFNLVIPSTIITIVAVIGFHTPSTSGRMRDAKFRLGIMTLMSMSVILLAIVEDMPKFSMSSSRKGRGSFSGIPLIGLYYFILLAIIGSSTVTTSMFVFLEKDLRYKNHIPWYLHWLSFDINTGFLRSVPSNDINKRLIVRNDSARLSPPPILRGRFGITSNLMTNYDEIDHGICNQSWEYLIDMIRNIELSVNAIRSEMMNLMPQDNLQNKWQRVIRRLEIISLSFYVLLIAVTVFLFFYHDWYCAIGHSPCGQANLKCPWMKTTSTHQTCF